MPLAAGQSLSHYTILEPLGAGGMGEVYRARDIRLEREVAIKVLPEGLAGDAERLRRFLMHRSRWVDGRWTEPEPLEAYPDGAGDTAVDMTCSADGNELVFLGRVPGGVTDPPGLDLWRMRREGEGWSLAEVLPPPVSTEHYESYPCLVADGSLYITSDRPGGLGESDVWRAQRLADGSYAEPVNPGAPVNSEHAEGDTWVSPDETVLVVTSRRPGGHGAADLWISTRDEQATGRCRATWGLRSTRRATSTAPWVPGTAASSSSRAASARLGTRRPAAACTGWTPRCWRSRAERRRRRA